MVVCRKETCVHGMSMHEHDAGWTKTSGSALPRTRSSSPLCARLVSAHFLHICHSVPPQRDTFNSSPFWNLCSYTHTIRSYCFGPGSLRPGPSMIIRRPSQISDLVALNARPSLKNHFSF